MTKRTLFAVMITAVISVVGTILAIVVAAYTVHAKVTQQRLAAVQTASKRSAVSKVDGLQLSLQEPIDGSPTARIALVEFGDFQCHFCGVFEDQTYPRVVADFVRTGAIRFAFENFPLQAIHPFAIKAAEAASCAAEQVGYWPMHAALFARQRTLSVDSLEDIASGVGVDKRRFEACMASSSPNSIDRELAAAKAAGVTVTPTFLLGDISADGRLLVRTKILGAQPYETFATAIKQLQGASENAREMHAPPQH